MDQVDPQVSCGSSWSACRLFAYGSNWYLWNKLIRKLLTDQLDPQYSSWSVSLKLIRISSWSVIRLQMHTSYALQMHTSCTPERTTNANAYLVCHRRPPQQNTSILQQTRSSTLHTPIHTSSPIGCVLISFMILSFLWIKFCALAIRLGWRHQTWDTAWDLHCHTARSNI